MALCTHSFPMLVMPLLASKITVGPWRTANLQFSIQMPKCSVALCIQIWIRLDPALIQNIELHCAGFKQQWTYRPSKLGLPKISHKNLPTRMWHQLPIRLAAALIYRSLFLTLVGLCDVMKWNIHCSLKIIHCCSNYSLTVELLATCAIGTAFYDVQNFPC